MAKHSRDDIPPTEPQVKTLNAGAATIDPPIQAATKIPGASLVPDFGGETAGTSTEYLYWVGIIPSCPVEGIDLAGISFPKLNERIIQDPGRPGDSRRVPVIGGLARLTEEKVRVMRDRLPLTVVRFTDGAESKGIQEEPGTGQNLGDLHMRPRKGHLIRIPTEEHVKARRASGKATRRYVRKKGDEPAARYMFAVLCADQDNPARGEYYPDVLENTGLEWPGKIEE